MTGSVSHGILLTQALHGQGIQVRGSLPRLSSLQIPSRHLGLITAEDLDHREERLTALADWVEESIDLDALYAALPEYNFPTISDRGVRIPEIRIAYARDRAFAFIMKKTCAACARPEPSSSRFLPWKTQIFLLPSRACIWAAGTRNFMQRSWLPMRPCGQKSAPCARVASRSMPNAGVLCTSCAA